MTETRLQNPNARASEDRVEIELGMASDLAVWLGVLLVLGYVAAVPGLGLLLRPERSVWLLAGSGACIVALHSALAILRRRGDSLRIDFARRPGGAPETTYAVRYRHETVLSGEFSPELLRVDTVTEHRTRLRLTPVHVYRLVFCPSPPATVIHRRYQDGIPLFLSDTPKQCLEEAVTMLRILKMDTSDVLIRMVEPPR